MRSALVYCLQQAIGKTRLCLNDSTFEERNADVVRDAEEALRHLMDEEARLDQDSDSDSAEEESIVVQHLSTSRLEAASVVSAKLTTRKASSNLLGGGAMAVDPSTRRKPAASTSAGASASLRHPRRCPPPAPRTLGSTVCTSTRASGSGRRPSKTRRASFTTSASACTH